jgi:hypothetical protein
MGSAVGRRLADVVIEKKHRVAVLRAATRPTSTKSNPTPGAV